MSSTQVIVGNINLDVEFTFHAGVRGRLTGPPELCFEEEPAEVWIDHIYHKGEDIAYILGEDVVERIQDIICIQWENNDDQF